MEKRAELKIATCGNLIDEPVEITLNGARPGRAYTLELEMEDEFHQVWKGRLQLDASGGETLRLSLEGLTPLLEYHGMNRRRILGAAQMGLFHLLKKWKTGEEGRFFIKLGSEPLKMLLRLYEEESLLDKKSLSLRFRSEAVEELRVKSPFSARYYGPKDRKVTQTVLVLGGSTGGFAWSEQMASVLASRGYGALALSYFDFRGRNGVPRRLEEIPLEVLKEALEWLREETGLKTAGILGISKGAEAALLTASHFPDRIGAVAAYVPSAYVFEGVYTGKWRNRSSWSLAGTPLPFLAYPPDTELGLFVKEGEIRRIHDEAITLAPDRAKKEAAIPVEKIQAPVLLISAGRDATWPSREMAHAITAKLKGSASCPGVKHLHYPEAGHGFLLPNLPPLLDSVELEPREAARANRRAWGEVLDFFEENRET